MPPEELEPVQRSGMVAIVGRPNVGKSTLLNAALGQQLAIISPLPQTTRTSLLGVLRYKDAQMGLLDTPGIHKPMSNLGRALNRSARRAADQADVIIFVTDLPKEPKGPLRVHPGDKTLLSDFGKETKVVLVINKVDLLKDKGRLLPFLQILGEIGTFAAVVPISARREDGITRVLEEVRPLLPEGAALFDEDMLTDRPARFFAAEFVREQILLATREEVPHAVAVEIEEYEEGEKMTRISAIVHVQRDGQRGILLGEGGMRMKEIGSGARESIERLLEKKVFLKLFVKVSPNMLESAELLDELAQGGTGEGNVQ